jgi:glycosyltransferase involved in cell wall biosynthesis
LLASDYEQFEIIVVDDGSEDNTSEVVKEYFADEARVRLLERPTSKVRGFDLGLPTRRATSLLRLMQTPYSRHRQSGR